VQDPVSLSPERRGAGLGTFAGVFTPSILTILGIILFLRTGFVVGNAGIGGALAIIAIATSVSVLTSISLAAIATNIEVRGGGDYYLISRTLGIEFGGAIGVVLFLAQSVSVAFYCIGFSEATLSLLGSDDTLLIRGIAAVAVIVIFGLAWAGADIATRFQFVIMAILIAALISFYLGAIGAFEASTFADSWTPAPGHLGFWAVFAVFFPAVTGFTQGVSMSGDLEDPGRSLPVGTFAAVGLSTVVYATVAILLAGGAPIDVLAVDDGTVMRELALFGLLVGFGVIAATLSSAVASFLGGPRILHSLATDRVFPFLQPFAKTHGPAGNPRPAVVLAGGIAMLTVGLGSVNVIAPVVSMFFLISYGLLNYATYYEARAASPSFRPRFRYFSRWASLAGAVLCGAAMLLINPLAGAAAIAALFVIYQFLSRRSIPARWADAAESHHFRRAVESIRAMDGELPHPRNWRPQIMVFSADAERRERLLRFSKWVEGNSGLTAAFRIVVGEGIRKRIEADREQDELVAEIADLGLDVHARAVLASDGIEALPVIVQSFGVGRLRANVVLFGWPESEDPDRIGTYVGAVREVARLGVSVMSLSTDQHRWRTFMETEERERRIDVWWEDNDSGRLALLAAYLCTRASDWRSASIRLLAPPHGDPVAQRSVLEQMVSDARIDAEVVLLDAPTHDDLLAATRDATLVLGPMHLRGNTIVDPFDGDMIGLAARLPMTAAFHAGQPIVLDTDPASGIAEEIIRAEQAATDAMERLSKLESQLEDAHADLETMDVASATPDEIADAEETLERIHRRVVTARARVERTQFEVDTLLSGQRTDRRRWGPGRRLRRSRTGMPDSNEPDS
jgi:amino acid transporter